MIRARASRHQRVDRHFEPAFLVAKCGISQGNFWIFVGGQEG